MASLPYPDLGSILVLLPNGRPAAGVRGYLYADEELTETAIAYRRVAGVKGPLLPTDELGRRYITIDAFGRQPRYFGPDTGEQSLWIIINGIVSRVDADYDPRIDALEARVLALEGGTTPPNPGLSGFSVDPDFPTTLIADTAFAGLGLDGDVLTVDTILAAGVSVDDTVLVVTI